MAIAVFPDRMNRIDPQDTEGSIRTLDTYIRYMVDQVEFALSNAFRTANGLGTSSAEMALMLTKLSRDLDVAASTLNALIATVNGKVDKVEGKGLSTNDYTDEDKADVGEIDGLVSTVNGKVDKVEGKGLSTNDYTDEDKADVGEIDGLDNRVTAIEAVLTNAGPILIQNAEDVTAAEGDDAIFSVRALGTNLTYKWELYYSSSWTYPNFQGRDTPNMTVPATASRNLYRFRCTITGGNWTIYSKTVTLHVTS